jgi:hypothetical protein
MHIDKAITWVENKKLDALYESLREKHYSFIGALTANLKLYAVSLEEIAGLTMFIEYLIDYGRLI